MNRIASSRDLDFVAAMHCEPRSIFVLAGSSHLLHRLSRRFSARIAVKGRSWIVHLAENSGIDPHVDTRVRPRLLRLEHDANLAIAKLLLPVDQQTETLRIGSGAQCSFVCDEPAPAD